MWLGSLQNKRAERNEMLLAHEFYKKKFVIPVTLTLLSATCHESQSLRETCRVPTWKT